MEKLKKQKCRNTFLFFYIYHMNTEELNGYYTKVNKLIDEYIEKWNIKPSRLRKYLKVGTQRFENFLMRNNLEEVPHINKIVIDVISDRISMERDNVLTYESYTYSEHDLNHDIFKGIEKANIELEKILADHFDTGLSSIDIIDSAKHIFSIDSWSEEHKVVIFSKEDIEVIKDNILEHFKKETKKEIMVHDLKINLSEIIDISKFEKEISNKITDDYTINSINSILSIDKEYELSKTKDYYIWVEK